MYGDPVTQEINASYVATFQHVNGTLVRLSFYDPNIVGVTATTNDDFQAAVDVMSNSTGWTFIGGSKDFPTSQAVNPT